MRLVDGRRSVVVADHALAPGRPVGAGDRLTSRTRGGALQIRGLQVTFPRAGGDGSVTAVQGFDLDLAQGERVAVVGESGSGKTSACLAIAGFLTEPSAVIEAEVARFGDDELALSPRINPLQARRLSIAMIFQDALSSLDPVWRIESQFNAVFRAAGVAKREWRFAATEWLIRLGLDDVDRVMRARPYELSGGMRQRVMLALTMASKPRLLIADEPTSALDAALGREILALISRLTEEAGISLLIVSHDINLVARYTDRVLVMYGGQVMESGAPDRLESHAAHPYTIDLLKSVPTLEMVDADQLPTIPPAVPPLTDIAATGCSFRNRCGRADDACTAMPPSVRVNGPEEPTHLVGCWYPIEKAR
jgi:peptide/nickel transport system ATP-binding protein